MLIWVPPCFDYLCSWRTAPIILTGIFTRRHRLYWTTRLTRGFLYTKSTPCKYQPAGGIFCYFVVCRTAREMGKINFPPVIPVSSLFAIKSTASSAISFTGWQIVVTFYTLNGNTAFLAYVRITLIAATGTVTMLRSLNADNIPASPATETNPNTCKQITMVCFDPCQF